MSVVGGSGVGGRGGGRGVTGGREKDSWTGTTAEKVQRSETNYLRDRV